MPRSRFRRLVVLGSSSALLLVSAAFLAGQTQPSATAARFNANGELIRPDGYREWVFVGTPLTPNDLNGGNAPFPEFHNVYIDPDSWARWKSTGEFRDGTVLVKELVSVGSKKAVSGRGYFMGDFVGLEATVKSKEQFPNEPGNWAYFSFGHSYPLAQTARAFPADDCNACHDASAADDWVFTQYYPVLRDAKGGKRVEGGAGVHDGTSCGVCQAGVKRFQQTAAAVVIDIPTDPDGLFGFLTKGEYKSWAAESRIRPTDAPHDEQVRTYINAILDESMTAGNGAHPAGSAAVKEMYDEFKNMSGWAVSVKVRADSDGGKNWYWYEVTSTTDSSQVVVEGMGPKLCISCHRRGGRDLVLVPYPLE